MTPEALLARFNCQPLMMDPSAVLGLATRLSSAAPLPQAYDQREQHLHQRTQSGHGVVPIRGELVEGSVHPIITKYYGVIGYDDVVAMASAAAADAGVHTIILAFDSPGGTAAGAFEASSALREIGQRKPMIAIAENLAASAAYLLGCAAEKFYVTEAGTSGSIGVILALVNMSGAAEKYGIKVKLLYAGDHKADGNPWEDLSEAAEAELKGRVTDLYGLFVARVSEFRSIDASAIRAQQSRTYIGAKAVAAGLADSISSTRFLLAAQAGEQEDDVEDTVEAVTAACPQAATELRAAGATAERTRIQAITTAAAGRPELAELVTRAHSEGMTLEAFAVEALAVRPDPGAQYLEAARADTAEIDAGRPAVETHAATQAAAANADPIKADWDADEKLRSGWADDYELYKDHRETEARDR